MNTKKIEETNQLNALWGIYLDYGLNALTIKKILPPLLLLRETQNILWVYLNISTCLIILFFNYCCFTYDIIPMLLKKRPYTLEAYIKVFLKKHAVWLIPPESPRWDYVSRYEC